MPYRYRSRHNQSRPNIFLRPYFSDSERRLGAQVGPRWFAGGDSLRRTNGERGCRVAAKMRRRQFLGMWPRLRQKADDEGRGEIGVPEWKDLGVFSNASVGR